MSKHSKRPWKADHSYPMFVGTAHAIIGPDFHCVVGRDFESNVIGNTEGSMSGLYQDSGHATPDGRRAEADKLLKIIEGYGVELTTKETSFVEQMADSETVSPKQLFWLRNIRDKYL